MGSAPVSRTAIPSPIIPRRPAAAMGVASPTTSMTPATSSTVPPAIARARAMSNPESARVWVNPSIPGPPNNPASFCRPRIASRTPTAKRRTNSPRSMVPRLPISSRGAGAMVVGCSPNGNGADMSYPPDSENCE